MTIYEIWKKKCNKKDNKIIKNRDQIWCKNKLKTNNKEWNRKQNSNRKGFKKIKRMKSKLNIKIKFDQMTRTKLKKKSIKKR